MMERSSDVLDIAADLAERERVSRLEEHKARAAEQILKPKGSCHYCDEPLEDDLVFCDEFCVGDYEYVSRRKKANGI